MENSQSKDNVKVQNEPKDLPKESRPQERGSIQIDTNLKIFDPNSGEVFLEGRG